MSCKTPVFQMNLGYPQAPPLTVVTVTAVSTAPPSPVPKRAGELFRPVRGMGFLKFKSQKLKKKNFFFTCFYEPGAEQAVHLHKSPGLGAPRRQMTPQGHSAGRVRSEIGLTSLGFLYHSDAFPKDIFGPPDPRLSALVLPTLCHRRPSTTLLEGEHGMHFDSG